MHLTPCWSSRCTHDRFTHHSPRGPHASHHRGLPCVLQTVPDCNPLQPRPCWALGSRFLSHRPPPAYYAFGFAELVTTMSRAPRHHGNDLQHTERPQHRRTLVANDLRCVPRTREISTPASAPMPKLSFRHRLWNRFLQTQTSLTRQLLRLKLSVVSPTPDSWASPSRQASARGRMLPRGTMPQNIRALDAVCRLLPFSSQ